MFFIQGDGVKTFGKLNVNQSFPQQSEGFFLIPVVLNKSARNHGFYRSYLQKNIIAFSNNLIHCLY